MNITLVCEDSFEGIMTAVYDAWVLMNEGHQVTIFSGTHYAPTFFSEYRQVSTDMEKADKVARSIRIKISPKAYVMVYRACMHYAVEKADIIVNFLKAGYRQGAEVIRMLHNPDVLALMELDRKVANEAHNFKGFLRFAELKGGALFGKIEPRCDVLLLLEKHFSERFPKENWIIYDEKRKKALAHPADGECVMVMGQNVEERIAALQKADEYEDLWKVFFDTIGIEARKNPKCQQTNLPQWYRKNMTEYQTPEK